MTKQGALEHVMTLQQDASGFRKLSMARKLEILVALREWVVSADTLEVNHENQ